jgi:hypothetical protein
MDLPMSSCHSSSFPGWKTSPGGDYYNGPPCNAFSKGRRVIVILPLPKITSDFARKIRLPSAFPSLKDVVVNSDWKQNVLSILQIGSFLLSEKR